MNIFVILDLENEMYAQLEEVKEILMKSISWISVTILNM